VASRSKVSMSVIIRRVDFVSHNEVWEGGAADQGGEGDRCGAADSATDRVGGGGGGGAAAR
jgi:hypothetical protein